MRRPPRPTLFPYTTLFRSEAARLLDEHLLDELWVGQEEDAPGADAIVHEPAVIAAELGEEPERIPTHPQQALGAELVRRPGRIRDHAGISRSGEQIPRGIAEQLFDLARETLVHRLAAQLEGGRQLTRLDAELDGQQAELLDRLVRGEAAVHLVDGVP